MKLIPIQDNNVIVNPELVPCPAPTYKGRNNSLRVSFYIDIVGFVAFPLLLFEKYALEVDDTDPNSR